MATVHRGKAPPRILTNAPEWWKHLRPENKRRYWKKLRRVVKQDLR